MARDEQCCWQCGRTNRLIYGRCPNCGAVNDGSVLRATTPRPHGGFEEDLDDLLVLAGLITPASALIVLGLMGVLPGSAMLVAVPLVLAAVWRMML
jgi:hypothetical protein